MTEHDLIDILGSIPASAKASVVTRTIRLSNGPAIAYRKGMAQPTIAAVIEISSPNFGRISWPGTATAIAASHHVYSLIPQGFATGQKLR